MHIKDWPAEAYAKLDPLPGSYREDGIRKFSPPAAEDHPPHTQTNGVSE